MTKKLEEESLFLENKYTRLYWLLIENAKTYPSCGYTEKHHIIPRSLGGSDDKDNLIDLSLRQHFICHRLLTKMTYGTKKKSMTFAVWRITTGLKKKGYSVNSRTYAVVREQAVNALRGHKNYLLSHSEESKQKIKEHQIKKQSKMSAEERAAWVKQSMSSPASWTEERKQKISRTTTGKKKTKTAQFYKSKEKTRVQRTKRLVEEAKKNKGKTWKVIDGKRVWMEKQ